MTYMLKSVSPNVAEVDLLDAIRNRSGLQSLSQDWLDAILPEMLAYLVAIPARCKIAEWLTWDDIDPRVQAILVGAFSRQAATGNTNVVQEQIGDYAVKYSDPALFEGRVPRWFTDGEELAISRLAGCGGGVYSVPIEFVGSITQSVVEDSVRN